MPVGQRLGLLGLSTSGACVLATCCLEGCLATPAGYRANPVGVWRVMCISCTWGGWAVCSVAC